MKRHPPLTVEFILSRLRVDAEAGRCFWVDATKHHANLNGAEAGCALKTRHGNAYWVIKLNGIPYKRAQLVLAVASGQWPHEMVDHINGTTLDDSASNLRHASAEQNAWNHRTRAKTTDLPMGVRSLPSGRFGARIRHQGTPRALGTFTTAADAYAAYLNARKELFGAYA